MPPDATSLAQQIGPYQPWFIIAGVIVLFILLRVTRKALRHRVDKIGRHFSRERGPFIWFWLNAPGVMLHELSHAFVVFLFGPWGFRITRITLFRIKPMVQQASEGRFSRSGGQQRQSLQLGEVQYVRPQGRFMSYVGDGFSGIAPLLGGIAMFILLYWVATGYHIWEYPWDATFHLQLLRPGWPWWTLTFAPYLILTVTSELWPSSQDWRGARRLVIGLIVLTSIVIASLWYFRVLVFNNALLLRVSSISAHIDFALVVLLALDICFFLIAEAIARTLGE